MPLPELRHPGAAQSDPRSVQALFEAWREHDAATAERLSLAILQTAPAQQQALAVLAQLRRAQGNRTAAEALLRRLTHLNPGDLYSLLDLGMLLLDRGDVVAADEYARHCIRIAPSDPNVHRLMGRLMTMTFRQAFAAYHHRRAIALGGEDPELLAILGWNLLNMGDFAEAKALYDQSLAQKPDDVQALRGAATTEEALKNFAAADALLERAARLAPADASIRVQHSIALGRRRQYEAALDMVGCAVDGSAAIGPEELLQKGRMLDRLGRFDAAFAAFEAGRQAEARLFGTKYDADAAKRTAGQLADFFRRERLALFEPATVRDGRAQPIFIVGYPRSGTSLVEQILTAHPQISAGDELLVVTDLTRRLPALLGSPLAYPHALMDLCIADRRRGLNRLRDCYLDAVDELGVVEAGTSHFTDRMPFNEMHLGLIGLMFPRAPIIHCIRHPLDSVLSMFSNRMDHGFHCGVALDSAARHYALVMALVDHYRSQMELNYLAVRYEDIVEDLPAHVRRLCDFVGVPFDERCLAFHEHSRYARTASFGQVAEPVYRQSRYRFQHYQEQLRGIEPILRPFIERFGYPGIDAA